MDVKKLLNEYQAICEKQKLLLMEYGVVEDTTMNPKSSSDIDGLPHGTKTIKKTENDAVKLSGVSLPLKQLAEEFRIKKMKVIEILMSLDNSEENNGKVKFKILWHHYIDEMNYIDIAPILNISYRQVFRIRDKAIQELQERYQDG